MARQAKKHRHKPRRSIFIGMNALAAAVAGFLSLVIFIESSFAWFTMIAQIESGEFKMAKVELTRDSTDSKVFEFKPECGAINAQLELKSLIDGREPAKRDENFAGWCVDNLSKEYFQTPKAASRMGLVIRNYSFKNGSDIPVYFRIDKAVVINSGDSSVPDIALAALWNVPKEQPNTETTPNPLIFDSESVCYYCPRPLAPDEKITVTFAAFITRSNAGTTGDFKFSAEYAEIIQATNNAVFMAEGWKKVAEELEPYTKAVVAAEK